MKEILLSYIIPVYNTSSWLKDCIDSLICHKGNDVEFIFIDDGSTDNSFEILLRYSLIDSRITLIRQGNKGLSEARNSGLEIAKGKYILFVDSDDSVNNQAILNMLTIAKEHDADIIIGQIKCIGNETMYYWWKSPGQYKLYKSSDFLYESHAKRSFVPMVFGYIFKKNIAIHNKLRFEPNIIHEDELWTPILFSYAETIIVTNVNHYNYRVNRPGSITFSDKKYLRCISLCIIIHRLLNRTKTAEFAQHFSFIIFFDDRFKNLLAIIYSYYKDYGGPFEIIKEYSIGHYLYFLNHVKSKMRGHTVE